MKGYVEFGHKKMIIWQNIDRIDSFVNEMILPEIHSYKRWLRNQIESALDSVGANFVEGYYSGSIREYLRFIRYSKRSLAELRDRIERCVKKKIISEELFGSFEKLACQTLYLYGRLINALERKL